MKKDVKIFLLHILESIERIERFTNDMSQDQFLQSDETQDAVLRRLTVIGEAVKNIPKAFRAKYPKIAWKEIAGLRDKLIHEYFGVDLKLTFEIATEDLPELKEKISNIVKKL